MVRMLSSFRGVFTNKFPGRLEEWGAFRNLISVGGSELFATFRGVFRNKFAGT